jgi:C4-dicarboxylate transporter DctQ subunit
MPSTKARRGVSILAVLLSLLYVGFVLTGATTYVLKMKEVASNLKTCRLRRWQVLAVMPLGFLLTRLALHATADWN